MFFWTYAANTVLPLGNIGIRRLPNESAVLDVLQRNIAEHSGISPGSDRRRIRRKKFRSWVSFARGWSPHLF